MVRTVVVVALVAGCGKKTETATPPHEEGSAKPTQPVATLDAAIVAPDTAPAVDAAAAAVAVDGERPNYLATLCPKVLTKIVECHKDPEFIAALDVGASAKDKKVNVQLLREVAKWPDGFSCSDLAPAYEHGGFVYHWDDLAAVPDALASCAKLGAAIRIAGGLFGGDQGN